MLGSAPSMCGLRGEKSGVDISLISRTNNETLEKHYLLRKLYAFYLFSKK